MLFHLTDFSALVPAQDCDTGITSLDPETMEEEIDFETMEEDIGFKTVEESLESQRESERRLMAVILPVTSSSTPGIMHLRKSTKLFRFLPSSSISF
jgi:hypothetical protein